MRGRSDRARGIIRTAEVALRLLLPLAALGCAPVVLPVELPDHDGASPVVVGADGRPTCDHPFPEVAATARVGLTCAPGDVAWADGRWFDDLQAAIDAAPRHGTVLVCPGEHPVAARIERHAIALSSVSGTAADTALVGPDRLLEVVRSTVTIADLTLAGTDVSDGGGALRVDGGALRLARVVATGHAAEGHGGVAEVAGATALVVEDATFEDAVARAGGALFADAACVVVVGSTFRATSAVVGDGGALLLAESTAVVVADSTFTSTVAAGAGGAITWRPEAWQSLPSSLRIEDATFLGGRATRGGAVFVAPDGEVALTIARSAFSTCAAAEGAAVRVTSGDGSASIAIAGGTFDGNAARPASAAVALDAEEVAVDRVDFGVEARNVPADVETSCGTQVLGAAATFSCDHSVWTSP